MANASRKRAVNSLTMKKVTSQIPQTFMVLGGLVLGHYLNEGVQMVIDKVAPATTPAADGTTAGFGSTLSELTKYAAPALLLIAGIVGPEFVSGQYGKYAKSIGMGVSAFGAAKGFKEVSGKDLLAGGAQDGMGLLTYYREPDSASEQYANFPQLAGGEAMSL